MPSNGNRGNIIGIGGIFFKSRQPPELNSWYENHLGIKSDPNAGVSFEWRALDNPERKHRTVWAIFNSGSKYFDPSTAGFMINYIVDDLDAILERLSAEGVRIDPRRETDAAGRFAWIYDPDGNKLELWEPG